MFRRAVLGCLSAFVALAAHAADYPVKPIRVIVPYAAGGADLYIRPLQEKLQAALGQPLVIENVGGGGGAVGAAKAARSEADGYTLLFAGTGAIITAPRLTGASYTWRDFAPVANVVAIPFTWVVRQDSPIDSFARLLELGRSRPGTLSYASPGHGTSTQMGADAILAAGGAAVTEIPYQGGAPALSAVLGGHVDAMIGAPSIVMPQVEAGTLRALAVTGPARFAPTPDVPAVGEFGVDVHVVANYGFFAPRGTPEAIVRRLAGAIQAAVADPAYVATMRKGYNDVAFLGPQDYTSAVQEEDRYFGGLMDQAGVGAAP
ncbi:tripartite tricarboxylate transporter substrate binding protein [Verticiella sediminum]|uniref:Tripartite tricarboxylate transporter substrate binding protein n=1 Tax=Verticiella sediminum TaxID=1247510 RepID=A0A556ALR0_9BURK|nr:tripartite tricarboxylate transporter substrate binding protein [Verticiella sediminum]TSH93816.1 tripartite tricarboxylate transporter substrate binding protein [Verticiella sediminum]